MSPTVVVALVELAEDQLVAALTGEVFSDIFDELSLSAGRDGLGLLKDPLKPCTHRCWNRVPLPAERKMRSDKSIAQKTEQEQCRAVEQLFYVPALRLFRQQAL
jgi:hypothetical protein